MAYTLQEDIGSAVSDQDSFAVNGGSRWWSFAWTAGASYTLTGLSPMLYKAGTASQVMTAYIYSTTVLVPNVSIGQATATVTASTLTTTPGDYTAFFPFAGVTIVNGTRYHAVIDGSSAVDSTNHPVWRYVGSPGGSETAHLSADGASWSLDESLIQGAFKTYITTGAGPVLFLPEAYGFPTLQGIH